MLVALRGAIDGANGLLFMALRRTASSARLPLAKIQAALLEARQACEQAINPTPPGAPRA